MSASPHRPLDASLPGLGHLLQACRWQVLSSVTKPCRFYFLHPPDGGEGQRINFFLSENDYFGYEKHVKKIEEDYEIKNDI